jgi:tRNA-specific 2-thiouridylase
VAKGEPLYVIATQPETRRVVVGREGDLLTTEFTASRVNWISIPAIEEPRRAQVRIRNRHLPAAATLLPLGDPARVAVRFDEPQRAVTPGQGAVFYDGDLVLGGGWID